MTIPEISKLEALSPTHVAKLLMILRKEGFVVSTRGQAGGYALARSAEQISVSEVLSKLGGMLYDGNFCVRHSGQLDVCTHSVDCSVRSLWQRVQIAVDEVLGRYSLADLANEAIEQTSAAANVTFFTAPPRRAIEPDGEIEAAIETARLTQLQRQEVEL